MSTLSLQRLVGWGWGLVAVNILFVIYIAAERINTSTHPHESRFTGVHQVYLKKKKLTKNLRSYAFNFSETDSKLDLLDQVETSEHVGDIV